MSEAEKNLEQQLALAWKQHVDQTSMSAMVTDTEIEFVLNLNDQEQGQIHFKITKGKPVKFAAYRTWADTIVPIERGLQYMVDLFRPGPNSCASRSVDLFFQTLSETMPASILQKLPYQKMLEKEQERLGTIKFDDIILRELGPVWRDTIEVCRDTAIVNINQANETLNFYAVEGEIGVVRRQAAKSFPILVEMMAKFGPIGRLIDEKKSFLDILAQIISVDNEPPVKTVRGVISKLSNVSVQFDRTHNHLTPTQFIRLLSSLPPDWLPRQSGPDADALVMLTDLALSILQQTQEPLSVLMQGAGGKWVDFATRVVKAQAETRPPEGATAESFAELNRLSETAPDLVKIFGLELGIAIFVKDLDDKNLVPEIVRTSIATWLLDSKLLRPDVERILPTVNLIEDMQRGFSDRVLGPLLMQSAGPAASGGIPDVYQQDIFAKAGQILMKGKPFPALLENMKKFRNDMATFMNANIPDDLTPDEIEAETEEQARAERQREMDRIMALRAEDDRLRRQEEFKKMLTSLTGGVINENDDQQRLRQFFGLDNPPKQVIWSPFIPILEAPNGIFIVPLITPEQLFDEGGDFGHGKHRDKNNVPCLNICVGVSKNYSDKCINGAQNIFSIRKKIYGQDGKASYQRLACLEVKLASKTSLQNVQFRGKNNGAVPDQAKIAADWLFASIKNGTVPFSPNPQAWMKHNDQFILIDKKQAKVDSYEAGGAAAANRRNPAEIAAERALERAAMIERIQAGVSDKAGYDWKDSRILRTVLRAWAPLLPKTHRGALPEQYKEIKEVKELIAKVFPSTQSRFQIRQAHR
jgi:hypothetical protein